MNVAYIRVSTYHQETANQRIVLEENYKIDKWYEEKASGKNTEDREVLKDMLDFVRKGDSVYIYDFSRLARSTKDLLDIVELLESKEVPLISYKEHIDSSTPTGKMLITVLGAIAEFERQNMLERQRLGIARARAEGKYANTGRKVKTIDENAWEREYERYCRREINKGQLCEVLGISRPKLEKILEEKGLKQSCLL